LEETVSDWVRKRFGGVGLTQSPPGPHFAEVQAKYRGAVLLCIDVSGSMLGTRLEQAMAGGKQFLAEAFSADYDCGLVLWHHDIEAYVPVGAPAEQLLARLDEPVGSGGTNLVPALELAKRDLAPLTVDRVFCVFGDGDVGDAQRARILARELCLKGVRIVVRGLGHGAASALSSLVCEGVRDEDRLITDEQSISAGIASMAKGLAAGRGATTGG
jgi:hypothetical protein